MTALIQNSHTRRLILGLLVSGLIWALSGPALQAQGAAQSSQATAQARTSTDQGAEFVREQFYSVLRQYSPTLGQLFRLDPGLMTREEYLAPYPAVAQYLKEHPEILRNPDYYLARFSNSYYYSDPRTRAWENMFEMISVFVIMLLVVFALGWTIRTAIDYRRWGRLAKVQAEVHTKLLDRFTGNDELLAYVKSPAGARFLESAPIQLDGGPRSVGAPLNRILWSLQAGVVMAAAGIGMNFVSRRIDPINSDPAFTVSVILLSVGIGFIASAGLSYVLSKRLGLVNGESAAGSQG